MTKQRFNPEAIADKLSRECLPRENMLDMGVDTWRKACKVLKALADKDCRLYPFVHVYEASRRKARECCDGDCLSEMIAVYEEHATTVVNNPKR
jgi:hypothetical protein